MTLVKVDWRPGPGRLREFGAVFALGCGLAGTSLFLGWPLARSEWTACAVWAAGILIGGLGLTGTRAALPGYWAWTAIGWILGNITSRVVLVLVFYLVVAPTGLAMRLTGRDRLGLRRGGGGSYWRDLEPGDGPPRHERQF